jgi:hypothetical protein
MNIVIGDSNACTCTIGGEYFQYFGKEMDVKVKGMIFWLLTAQLSDDPK